MEITTASLLVDFNTIRCGNCKVALHDELAEKCPVCSATFDRIASNHVGLSQKLQMEREEAGVHSFKDVPKLLPGTTNHRPGDGEKELTTASLLVDFITIRCGNCKVALHDELAEKCPVCSASFDRIASNHVGLSQKLQMEREEAGLHF